MDWLKWPGPACREMNPPPKIKFKIISPNEREVRAPVTVSRPRHCGRLVT